MSTYLPALIMGVLFVINVPVAFAIGMAALVYFIFAAGVPTNLFVQRMLSVTESFPLLAVPLFILVGTIMNHAGITRRLFVLADVMVGRMRGGLAQVNVLLSALMGGMSASANADAAMQSKMIAPEMVKRGFSPGFTAGITACSAVITPIIPPGIGLILYGFLADVSVGRLFLGGIIPGLLITVALMALVSYLSARRGYKPQRTTPVPWSTLLRAFVDALGGLSIAVFIIVGIRFGVFTPTEAGAMTVLYALAIGFLWHRELKLSHIPAILTETVVATAAVMMIIAAASAFGFYMTWERIPTLVASALVTVTENPWLLLLLINLLLIVVGMLLEGTAALILLTPILTPVVVGLGVDPVHFGLVIVLNLTIGGATPPVGTLMFTACSVMRVKVETYTAEAWPMVLVLFVVLFLITFVPGFVTFLPDLLMG